MVHEDGLWFPEKPKYTMNETNSFRTVELTYAVMDGLTFSEAKDTRVAIEH